MRKALSTTYKHMRRTPYQALSAVAVLSLTFFIATIYFLVMTGSEKILRYFETRPQVTVFFQDEATDDQIDILREKLTGHEGVSQTTFISKEEALEIYKEQNKDEPLLLEMVTADILPASLEISATDVSYLSQIAKIASDEEGVEEVVFQEDVINALTSWTRAIRIAGVALLSFLAATAMLIILIIIGLKISARKVEIEILRLLGATNWFIIGPFIMEGVIYGVLGAFFAWGTSYVLLLYSTPFLISFLGDIPLVPVPFLFMAVLLAGMLTFGTAIGSIAALIAVRRFLR
ncbi:ABC transporter permease [Patescibacteria group bacterium]|nr:ABC transporter permease [Patescibacteria group bacterium]